jgi:hypothetical protein
MLALGVAAGALACGDDGGPQVVASVTVTSPIGDRLAVGRSVQLSAEARDDGGSVLPGAVVSWSSSAPEVASIVGFGVVLGARAGSATITAQASTVTGGMTLRVIAADLDGIETDLSDPFTFALAGNLGEPTGGRVRAALDQCAGGVVEGNFETIETCLAIVRTELAGATDPTDRPLLATLALFLDHIERLLNLPTTVLDTR